MKKTVLLLIGIFLVSSVFAQPGVHRGFKNDCKPQMKMEERGFRGENREGMMAFMLSEKLDLTTEQADKFFPRFREHQEAMEKIRKEALEANQTIQDKIKDGKEISDAELKYALKGLEDLQKKKAAERKKFIDSLDGILDNTQITKLAFAPQRFGHHQKVNEARKERCQNRW